MKKVIRLEKEYEFELYPKPPFNFEGTVHKPSHFPSSNVYYEDTTFWQTITFNKKVYGIKMQGTKNINNPIIRGVIYSSEPISDKLASKILSEIEFRLDLNADLSEFYNECSSDPVLSAVLKRWKGMRVSVFESLYEFLVITTVLQNATVRRSVQMLENLFEKYGTAVIFDGRKLFGFWPPSSIYKSTEEELRNIKLGYRAKILKKQAKNFVKEIFDEDVLRKLPTSKLKKRLLSIYGVGPASVQYILFEVFKRYDALEYIPPWEQKIYSRLLFNKELVESDVILDEVKKRWGRWRMLAMHYIFEDLFWKRKTQKIEWLEKLIRL